MSNGKNTKSKWAVAELTVSYEPIKENIVKILSSQESHQVLLSMWDKELMDLQEQFSVFFLNRNNEMIGYKLITTGNLTSTIVDKKFIASLALSCMACSVIVAHNHPSGNLKPSKQDIDITKQLSEGMKLLDIKVIDHLILSSNGYYSFAEEGLIES